MKASIVKPQAAFTLLELLVAATITVAIVAMLLLVAQTTLKTWQVANGRWGTSGVALPALDLIERDLKSAVMSGDNVTSLAVTILQNTSNSGIWETPSRFPKPTSDVRISDTITECRFGATAWLRFFAGTSATIGNQNRAMVRAVSYQIVRRPLSGTAGEATYMLFRGHVNEANTLVAGSDILAIAYDGQNATDGNSGNVRRPNANHVIADNVVDFGVRFYARRAERLVPIFPAQGEAWSSSVLNFEWRSDLPTDSTPVLAEVMIRVLTEDGVQRLRAFEDSSRSVTVPSDWWEFVEANSHAYVRRVWMMNQRL